MFFEALTERELEILTLIAEGLSNKEIGERLDLSPETVKWYNKRIFAKLDVNRRTQAVAYAQELGLLDTPLPSPATPSEQTPPRLYNLPVQLTSFVGREREIEIVKRLLGSNRLLTLTGPGGTGKTRLALEVADRMLAHYPDGVIFVGLASLDDPDLVLDTVADSLGLKQQPGEPLFDTAQRLLSGRKLLLILDNFEHVLSAAPQVAELLVAAPTFSVLITSRESLRLSGEQQFPVLPLEFSAVGKEPPAVSLFAERAQAINPSFQLDEQNHPAVASICAFLDGLPLAIELAAARSRYFSPRMLLARLQVATDHSRASTALEILSDGTRDLPARQQTLRATIDWSYHLLAAEEQALFRRLAVFAGGCSVEAVEAVCASEGKERIMVPLFSLVDKNLLRVADDPDGEPRFSMLHIIREYARERLQRLREAQQVGERHAHYYVKLVEEAEAALTGPEQASWLSRLEMEHDNLRVALRWVRDNDQVVLALRLVSALWRFWLYRTHFHEGLQWLDDVLALEGDAPDDLRAMTLHGMGEIAHVQRDLAVAHAAHEQSLTLRGKAGDTGGMADSLVMLGIIVSEMGDYDRAEVVMNESLILARELDDKSRTAYALAGLGINAIYQDNQTDARQYLAEALDLFRAVGDRAGICSALNNLGVVELYSGKHIEARQYFDMSLRIARRLHAPHLCAITRNNIGLLAARSRRLNEATSELVEALRIFLGLEDRLNVAWCLEGLAAVAARQRRAERAGILWGAASALRDALQAVLPPVEQKEQERLISEVRATATAGTLEQAWKKGEWLALEDFEGLMALATDEDTR